MPSRWTLLAAAGLLMGSVHAAPPQRILSLCTTATDVLCAIGAGERLSAIDEYGTAVPEASKVPVIVKGSAISKEEVLARKVDLAFVWWYQDDAAKLLRELRVPVERIRCGRAGELPATVRTIGRRVGREVEANRLADQLTVFLRDCPTTPAPDAPRVYLELYSPSRTMGTESYLNDLIMFAGGINIAGGATRSSVLLSQEELLVANPSVILFVRGFATPEAIARRPRLFALPAVRRGAVVALDRQWLIAGSRLPEAVAHLRAAIHKDN